MLAECASWRPPPIGAAASDTGASDTVSGRQPRIDPRQRMSCAEFMNKGRLIDRVLLSGSSVPMRLYCVRGPGGGGGSRGPGPGVELHRAGGEPGLEWAWANYSTRLVRHTFPSPKWFNGLNFACSTLEDDRWDEVSDGEAARPQAHVKVDPLKMWSHVVLFPHCSWELSLSLSVV